MVAAVPECTGMVPPLVFSPSCLPLYSYHIHGTRPLRVHRSPRQSLSTDPKRKSLPLHFRGTSLRVQNDAEMGPPSSDGATGHPGGKRG